MDVTHVPLVIQVRDLFFIKSQKMIFFTLKQCVFLDFRGCEGSGACFERLRMRSRSTRKCADRNAGDLGRSLAVCACVYDPIHVTAQGKSLGPNCACVQPPRHNRGLPTNACVLYPMRSIHSCHILGLPETFFKMSLESLVECDVDPVA